MNRTVLYTLCFNEEFILPYFLRHYRRFVDRIVVYDNQSTDRSVAIAEAGGAEVRNWVSGNEIRDDIMLDLKGHCWEECRGQGVDWVIVVDVDELLYHPVIAAHLAELRRRDYTFCVPQGFQMVGDELPGPDEELTAAITRGVPVRKYSKPCIFNPDAIEALNFLPGCHEAQPIGRVKVSTDPNLKLLHYSWLSFDWYRKRYAERAKRLSELNRQEGWGREYMEGEREMRERYEGLRQSAVDAIDYREGLLLRLRRDRTRRRRLRRRA
jgi:glycosyltransferase involved in cell wall biosynthesis